MLSLAAAAAPYAWPIAIGLGALGLVLLVTTPAEAAVMPGCSRRFYPARLVGGLRRRTDLLVLHSTESGVGAANDAAWFQNPAAKGSAHVVVGEDGCFESVDADQQAAGAPPVNDRAFHLEVDGMAKWSRSEWFARRRTIELARAVTRAVTRRYGLPRRLLGVDALRRGERGVTTHAAVSLAFGKSDHLDPCGGLDCAGRFPVDLVLD